MATPWSAPVQLAVATLAVLAALGSCAAITQQPNFVLMYTDDQDLLFDSLQALPWSAANIFAAGAAFSNFHAHTPVCCPSRSEMLTGRYFHNLRTGQAGDDGCMHVNTSDHFQQHLVFSRALKDAGYGTQMVGKYLNSEGMTHVCGPPIGKAKLAPPNGWHSFSAMCPDTCYVNCTFVHNGKMITYNDSSFTTPGGNYAPAVIGNLSASYVEQHLISGRPFFTYIAPHSPHGPATPAPWYTDRFPNVSAPRTPTYNVSAPDHHWAVASQPPVDAALEASMDDLARNRLRTLLTVDDTLRELHELIGRYGQLNNTYWLFTSDHGFHMGQFCLGACKRQPYDSDIRVPFFIAGPGIAAQQVVHAPAGIPDIAPTILELAGVPSDGLTFDGQSMVGLLKGTVAEQQKSAEGWRTNYFIEYYGTSPPGHPSIGAGHVKDSSNNTFRGVRDFANGSNLAYFEFTDAWADWAFVRPAFFELYDVSKDPDQLHNLYRSADQGTKDRLADLVQRYYSCAGETCASLR